MQINPPLERPIRPRLYHSGCPYLPVKMRGQYEDSLLDTGAEINLMSLDLVEDMGLSRYLRKAKFIHDAVGFNGDREKFVGMIEDFVVSIAGVDILTNVYVTNTLDPTYRFILGRPFQKAAQGSVWEKDDDTCIVSLTDSYVGKRIQIIAQTAPDFEEDRNMITMVELAHMASLKD